MRKGLKRLVTIIFIPHNQRNSYNLRIPLAILYFFIFLCIGTIVLSGLFLFKFRAFSQTKRAHLELFGEVAKIRETMNNVQGLEARLKVLTGSSRETEIATGGPAQENPRVVMEEEFLEREERSLSELEAKLQGRRVKEAFLPSISPVEKGWIISTSPGGLEIASLLGSVVRATAEGKVLCASGGKVIIDHENNLRTGYGNIERMCVKVGEKVKKGAIIGYLKSKAISYQVKKFDQEIDPLSCMSDLGG